MTETKTSLIFWVLAGLALVWNLLGVGAFISQMSMTPEALAALPQVEQDRYAATPWWVNVAFAVAVFAGAIGCVLLLMKKPVAHTVLWISLIAVVVQMGYLFLASKSFEVYGPGEMIMPIMVIIIAVVLVWYSRRFVKS